MERNVATQRCTICHKKNVPDKYTLRDKPNILMRGNISFISNS